MGESKGLVLVVEDEKAIADLERLYLSRAGYGVQVEADGRAGLAAARALHPVAIILDVGLPILDGTEVCRALRADGDWTPVLFVTARDDEVDRVVGLERVRLFWSDLIVSVRNCPTTICGGGRGMAGVLQPATTCSNSSRDRPNTPAASLLLLRIPLAPLLSHVLVSTPTNVAGRSPSNDQVRHKTPGHTRRRPHSRGAAPDSISAHGELLDPVDGTTSQPSTSPGCSKPSASAARPAISTTTRSAGPRPSTGSPAAPRSRRTQPTCSPTTAVTGRSRTASTTFVTAPTTRTVPRCGPVPRPRSWRRCATSRSACSAWPAGPTSSGPPRRCPAASARPAPSSASSSVEQKGGDHHTATLTKALGDPDSGGC